MNSQLLIIATIPGLVALFYILWRVERYFTTRRAKREQNDPRSQYDYVCYPILDPDSEVILVSGRHKREPK